MRPDAIYIHLSSTGGHSVYYRGQSGIYHCIIYYHCAYSRYFPEKETGTAYLDQCGDRTGRTVSSVYDRKPFPEQRRLSHINLLFLFFHPYYGGGSLFSEGERNQTLLYPVFRDGCSVGDSHVSSGNAEDEQYSAGMAAHPLCGNPFLRCSLYFPDHRSKGL